MIKFLTIFFLPGLLIVASCSMAQHNGPEASQPVAPTYSAEAETVWGLRIRTANETFAVSQDGGGKKKLPHIPVLGEFSPDKSNVLSVGLEQGQYELYVSDAWGKNRR